MSIPTSVLFELLHALPLLRTQIYFKSSLTALSHAMEDQVLAGTEPALVIACFQRERFYRQETHRYRRIGNKTDQVYVLAAPETEFQNSSQIQEAIAFEPDDGLAKEWHLVVLAPNYSTCLVCREKEGSVVKPFRDLPSMDQSRRFEGIWTFDRQVSCTVARLLLERVRVYRPELEEKIQRAIATYRLSEPDTALEAAARFQDVDPGPFVQRLVTYLQVGQHKLVKTYRSIAAQERRERLVNSITTAIRQSLNPADIFQVAVRELGGALDVCRCLIYRCKATDQEAAIAYEFLGRSVKSLSGKVWPLQENPLFQEVVTSGERVVVENLSDPRITGSTRLVALVREWEIESWLMVPVFYQNQLVGMVELHHCGGEERRWDAEELAMVEAIATQIGVATLQAEAYANLEDLNEQLAALDRTRSNLIAITGHELRTPLSTIQVCLESLASDPDMPPELRQVMLSTALDDAERMRTLVQDFLTLSRLESGRVEWNTEVLPLHECLSLAISSVRTRTNTEAGALPTLTLEVPEDLPLVRADGEWLVEVLSKLIDNACKFTPSGGKVTILAQPRGDRELEVKVADTGRGISSDRLETVFDRFYQEEGALRRSTGGTGLGLAICRQIVTGWGGQIWAKSAGKDCGTQFYFTIPIATESTSEVTPNPSSRSKSKSQKGDRSSGSSRDPRTPIR